MLILIISHAATLFIGGAIGMLFMARVCGGARDDHAVTRALEERRRG